LVYALAVSWAWHGAVAATPAPPSTDAPVRPRICVVLSGGGARGMAHIGVLKILDELKIPIDCIAGTSMGAIVGGLYASGMTVDQIESTMLSVDWQEAFHDAPPRRDLTFRRKQDDRNFLVTWPLGLKHGKILLPKGFIQGQKLQETLRQLTLPFSKSTDFDLLPTPFRAVATDLETGNAVVMGEGDLSIAMRASVSAPGVFAPVELNGRLLVDGGLAENLPIDVARAMHADILIVSDVSFPLQPRAALDSALSISNQMLAILVRKDSDRQRASLGSRDVLIEPDLGLTPSTAFSAAATVISRGEDAARADRAALQAYSVGDTAYREYLARRGAREPGLPPINFVRVDPQSKRYEKTILAEMQPLVGKPLDPDQVGKRITELYGLGMFETLDYTLVEQPAGTGTGTGAGSGTRTVASTDKVGSSNISSANHNAGPGTGTGTSACSSSSSASANSGTAAGANAGAGSEGRPSTMNPNTGTGSGAGADAGTCTNAGDEDSGLEIQARRKSWGPNYLRFGLNLQDDFQGDGHYNAAARFVLTEINQLGAELLTDVQIGTDPKLVSEFYQPIDATRTWFVAPSARIEVRDLPVYNGNNSEVADFRDREAEADLDFGSNLGDWGEIRVGYHRTNGETHDRFEDADLVTPNSNLVTPTSDLVTPTYNIGEYFFKFSYDQLDNVHFPRDGQSFTLQWDANRVNLGGDMAYDKVTADWLMARSIGRNTILLWTSAGITLDGHFSPTDLPEFYSLGGLFNLSGLAPTSLTGEDYAIARAIYFRKIGHGGEGFFEFPAYIGMSFEAGNVWQRRSEMSFGSLRKDGSIFIAFDTPLGPVYLGSGYDQSGAAGYYLFLGRTF
jgi:predicted acylesterase/phospholipase RssA